VPIKIEMDVSVSSDVMKYEMQSTMVGRLAHTAPVHPWCYQNVTSLKTYSVRARVWNECVNALHVSSLNSVSEISSFTKRNLGHSVVIGMKHENGQIHEVYISFNIITSSLLGLTCLPNHSSSYRTTSIVISRVVFNRTRVL